MSIANGPPFSSAKTGEPARVFDFLLAGELDGLSPSVDDRSPETSLGTAFVDRLQVERGLGTTFLCSSGQLGVRRVLCGAVLQRRILAACFMAALGIERVRVERRLSAAFPLVLNDRAGFSRRHSAPFENTDTKLQACVPGRACRRSLARSLLPSYLLCSA